MHCVLIGVAKRTLALLLGAANIEILPKRCESIKLPSHVRQMVRLLNKENYWVVKDWVNFLLFYNIPLIKAVPKEHDLQYWSQLVEVDHMLLGTEITISDLITANHLLRKFIWETQEKFTAMVDNCCISLIPSQTGVLNGQHWTLNSNLQIIIFFLKIHGISQKKLRWLCHISSTIKINAVAL